MDKERERWDRMQEEEGEGLEEQALASEWDGESVASLESGRGGREQEEDEEERIRWAKKMEELERYEKRMEEQVRNKKKAEEEREKAERERLEEQEEEEKKKAEEERRKLEEERRRAAEVNGEEESFEQKVAKIQKGLKDITGAVSREDAKNKFAFGRAEQQLVKNAVIDLLNGLVGLTVGQRNVERKAKEWEDKCVKMQEERDSMKKEWEKKQEDMTREIERLGKIIREREGARGEVRVVGRSKGDSATRGRNDSATEASSEEDGVRGVSKRGRGVSTRGRTYAGVVAESVRQSVVGKGSMRQERNGMNEGVREEGRGNAGWVTPEKARRRVG